MISRIITYALVSILVVSLLWMIRDQDFHQPRGIFLASTQEKFAPTMPSEVMLLQDLPAQGKVIGNLNLMVNPAKFSEETQKQALEAGRQLAAAQGANALVIQYFFAANSEGGQTYVLNAKAVRFS